jgi:hypothetical protein
MRDGIFVAENNTGKETLFVDYLADDEVLCESNFLAEDEEQLEPIAIAEKS